jgi:hypothetical protein
MSAYGVAAVCAAALALGCEEQPILRPTPVVTTPPSNWLTGFLDRSTGPWRFAGTVYEHTASASFRPLAGLQLRVSELSGGTFMTRFVTSDGDGRYELMVGDAIKVEPALETGYLAPCPAGTDSPNWSGGPSPHYMPDVHVVHQAVLSTTGTPDFFHSLGPYNSGRVLEPAPSRSPIEGAHVELDNYGFVLSTTLSDTAGRFLLCSFPPGSGTDQSVIVRARKPGYLDGSRELTFFSAGDIELIPQ